MPIKRYGPSTQVTATTTSAAYALPNSRPRLELVNRGMANIYVALGASDVTVSAPTTTPTNSLIIPPGAILEVEARNATHVALLAESGTARVVIQQGT
jgi:hypothetical protein